MTTIREEPNSIETVETAVMADEHGPHLVKSEWEEVSINYSREATMVVGKTSYSAFQRNSFNALVQFENGDRVGVVLPPGACREGYAVHNNDVLMSALAARASGLDATFMTTKDNDE